MGDGIAERHLLAAVLLRAVRDYGYTGSHNPEEARVAESAREWIFDDTDELDHIGTFCTICRLMDLDVERVRDRIRCMSSRQARGVGGLALAAAASGD